MTKLSEGAGLAKDVLNDVVAARQKSGLSQTQFARALQISVRTLQGWEQGRRHPSGAARALIQIALRHPEVIKEGLDVESK